jgi:16S rRNA (uracil1498-N3)-methyltransferase
VTYPVFLATADELQSAVPGGVVTVLGAEARHALKARRLRIGEYLQLVDGQGRRVSGCLVAADRDEALCMEVTAVEDEPQPEPRLTVVQALAKGDRAERAVESMTEVGVDEIVPWQSARSVVRWSGAKAERGRERWVAISREATKQSRRARMPVISPLADGHEVCARVASADLAVILDSAGAPIRDFHPHGDVVLIVGPEGGISEDEVRDLTAAGAVLVRLGPEILRASTAGTVALAAILAASPRWA